jgi:hypothetical protein
VALWISLAVIVLAAAGKFFIAPAIVRYVIGVELPRYWDGSMEIDGVSVGFRSVQLRGVTLKDRGGRVWLRAGSLSASPGMERNLQAGFRDVDLDDVEIRLQFIEGRCQPPARNVDELIDRLEQVTRIRMLHADGTITLERPGGPSYSVGPLELDIGRANDGHRVVLRRIGRDETQTLRLAGRANWGSSDFDGNVAIHHRITPADGHDLAAILAIPGVDRAAVTLRAELDIAGRWTQPLTWRPTGTASLGDGRLVLGGVDLLNDLAGEFAVTSDANSVTAVASDLAAKLAGGRFAASGSLTLRPDGSTDLVSYRGSVTVDRAAIGPVVEALSHTLHRGVSGESLDGLGTLQLRYDVRGDGLALRGLRGRGVVRLQDADLARLPVMPALIRRLRGSAGGVAALGDAEAAVRSVGALVTLRQARIAGPLLAIELDPGGTVNLAEGTVDLFAVGVPLDKLQGVLEQLPVLRILGFLQRSLTRVHVKGNWLDGEVTVTAAPMPETRLGEETRAFFLSAARAGGDLPGHLIGRFRTMFSTLDLFQTD